MELGWEFSRCAGIFPAVTELSQRIRSTISAHLCLLWSSLHGPTTERETQPNCSFATDVPMWIDSSHGKGKNTYSLRSSQKKLSFNVGTFLLKVFCHFLICCSLYLLLFYGGLISFCSKRDGDQTCYLRRVGQRNEKLGVGAAIPKDDVPFLDISFLFSLLFSHTFAA